MHLMLHANNQKQQNKILKVKQQTLFQSQKTANGTGKPTCTPHKPTNATSTP